jgi:hypothetical protein
VFKIVDYFTTAGVLSRIMLAGKTAEIVFKGIIMQIYLLLTWRKILL